MEQGAIRRCYGEEMQLLPLKRDLLIPKQILENAFTKATGDVSVTPIVVSYYDRSITISQQR